MVRHLTNCCYVSLLLGTHLSGYLRHQRWRMPEHVAQDVRQLGLGAFVHDLGKTRLSDEAREIHALHPRANNREYQSHARVGCEMFRGQLSPLVVYLIAHHHQRYDGSGFPKVLPRSPGGKPAGLAGEKIHVFARILAVANTFDRLLGTPKKPRLTIQALHAMQQPTLAAWFDPVILAALNRLVPPFMAGSIVTLTDGRLAVVVENHGDAPCSPSVRIIYGEPGTPTARVGDETLDLRYTMGLEIGMSEGVDVRPYYFLPMDISEGVLAYWGLRNKAVKALHVDPASLVTDGDAAAQRP
jgi:HD-GYP domain-containing protein (c-di-GMP phosphodiesterase class II)